MAKVNDHNDLHDVVPIRPAQEAVDWVSLSFAVPREMRDAFYDLARRMHLKPSQYGRMIIADFLQRAKAA